MQGRGDTMRMVKSHRRAEEAFTFWPDVVP